jgi:hypothetical protein
VVTLPHGAINWLKAMYALSERAAFGPPLFVSKRGNKGARCRVTSPRGYRNPSVEGPHVAPAQPQCAGTIAAYCSLA